MSQDQLFISRSEQGIQALHEHLPHIKPATSAPDGFNKDGHVETVGAGSCETTDTGWLLSSSSLLSHFGPAILFILNGLKNAGKLPQTATENQGAPNTVIDNPLG